jgi:hypothetical protein
MPSLERVVFAAFLSLPLFAQEAKPAPAAPAAPAAEATKTQEPKVLELGARVNGELTLTDIDGKTQRAHDLMGKITVVNFYSTQCPIQAAWDGRLAQIQKDYEGKGVVFLHIDSNVGEIGAQPQKAEGDKKAYEDIRAHLAKKELPFRVFVDHGNVVADLFAARTTPHVYVFGKDGRLVYKGLVDDDQRDKNAEGRTNYLRDTLDKLGKGDKVEPFATKEVGCSIKRMSKDGEAGGGRKRGAARGDGNKGGGDK